jgi:hypothetical protein
MGERVITLEVDWDRTRDVVLPDRRLLPDIVALRFADAGSSAGVTLAVSYLLASEEQVRSRSIDGVVLLVGERSGRVFEAATTGRVRTTDELSAVFGTIEGALKKASDHAGHLLGLFPELKSKAASELFAAREVEAPTSVSLPS